MLLDAAAEGLVAAGRSSILTKLQLLENSAGRHGPGGRAPALWGEWPASARCHQTTPAAVRRAPLGSGVPAAALTSRRAARRSPRVAVTVPAVLAGGVSEPPGTAERERA